LKSLFYILFFLLLSFDGSAQINFPALSGRNGNLLPVLATTTAATSVTTTSANSGGNVTSDGGAIVTTRGIVWSTSPNPVISLSTKTTNGSGIGSFSSSITGLTINTTYYVRAYATNSIGTGYGTQVSFSTYTYVTICKQQWMEQNLDVTTYRDGTVIPYVDNATAWNGLTTGAWCYYNNDPANGAIYGKLYNWYAVNDSRGLAPQGWHIPTDAEWTTLGNLLGGNSAAGGKMKTTGTTRWTTPNTSATNESGYAGLPGGLRDYNGSFSNVGDDGYWWSATVKSADAWCRNLYYTDGNLYRIYHSMKSGFSVRCLRDLKIGDPYAGGIVAYILVSGDPGYDANTQHGLIAATSNQSFGIMWYNNSYTNVGSTGEVIGTGLSNTNKIIASQFNTGSYAAKLCADYTVTECGVTYDDWYLPSKNELAKLYEMKKLGFGDFANNSYWSSTDYLSGSGSSSSSFYARGLTFQYGGEFYADKSTTQYVRAIRAF
jgi:uncharacterized protein (TIGR02145 family)